MTGSRLKATVAVCMLIDHAAAALIGPLRAMGVLPIPEGIDLLWLVLRGVGRLAFPVFAFLISEGCRYTKRPGRYLGRLFLFALISEIPFRLVFVQELRLWPLCARNVFFTLGFGALACMAWKKLRARGSTGLAAVPVCVLAALAELLDTDYGALGVLLIFTAYVFRRERETRLLAMGGLLTLLYLILPLFRIRWDAVTVGSAAFWSVIVQTVVFWLCGLASLLLIALYNGQRGRRVKWLFYLFYPAHIMLLYLTAAFLFPALS